MAALSSAILRSYVFSAEEVVDGLVTAGLIAPDHARTVFMDFDVVNHGFTLMITLRDFEDEPQLSRRRPIAAHTS